VLRLPHGGDATCVWRRVLYAVVILTSLALATAPAQGTAKKRPSGESAGPGQAAAHKARVRRCRQARQRNHRRQAAKCRRRRKPPLRRREPPVDPPVEGTVTLPVAFRVTNSNGSAVPCPSDGKTYELKGLIVGPADAIRNGVAGTLYLHDFAFGSWFWHFTGAPGYDFVGALAADRHVSVIIDRLGYGDSGHPAGNDSCLGAQADVAHQVVSALRAGTYEAVGHSPVAFGKVALAGHTGGAAIAEIEAYSFHDVDALVLMAWADQGFSNQAETEVGKSAMVCANGGEDARPGGPGGYAYFGQTAADFQALVFHSASPEVVAAATALRQRDPCGDYASLLPTVVRDQTQLSSIAVPVLLAYGQSDALFPPPAGDQQKASFSGADDLTEVVLDGTGNALALEQSAPTLQRLTSDWLRAHGF
jgi:pimeloyl-ACP methyl ester carboxylesterase